jgi:hypothetical protein
MARFFALVMTFCLGWTSTSSLWGEGFPPPPVPSVMAWTSATWSQTLGSPPEYVAEAGPAKASALSAWYAHHSVLHDTRRLAASLPGTPPRPGLARWYARHSFLADARRVIFGPSRPSRSF